MTTVEKLVNQTCSACDRIQEEWPDYSDVITTMKSDLTTYPSAKHAQSVLNSLLEIAKGEYEYEV